MIERTSCSCELCRIGCYTMPGMCGVCDVEAIADLIGGDAQDIHWVQEHFSASIDSLRTRIRERDGSVSEVPVAHTIVPKQREHCECVFLSNGACTIHSVSPAGCRLVDVHMDAKEVDARMHHSAKQIIDDALSYGPYAQLAWRLTLAGSLAEPLTDRKAAYIRAEVQLRGASVENPLTP